MRGPGDHVEQLISHRPAVFPQAAWRSWQKMGFACREELAIKGIKPNKLIPFQ
jgi:hypothetical protein